MRIHAFYLPAPGASRALLFLHGNAGNASHRLPNAALLAALKTHVLLLDYRGFGRSEGSPTEQGLYADARAGLAHLEAARDLLAADGPAGRGLDFLCQEFIRETNTLCSKSTDVELTGVGLGLKSVIAQLREQVQNVE